jgi:hypothetical protein
MNPNRPMWPAPLNFLGFRPFHKGSHATWNVSLTGRQQPSVQKELPQSWNRVKKDQLRHDRSVRNENMRTRYRDLRLVPAVSAR